MNFLEYLYIRATKIVSQKNSFSVYCWFLMASVIQFHKEESGNDNNRKNRKQYRKINEIKAKVSYCEQWNQQYIT